MRKTFAILGLILASTLCNPGYAQTPDLGAAAVSASSSKGFDARAITARLKELEKSGDSEAFDAAVYELAEDRFLTHELYSLWADSPFLRAPHVKDEEEYIAKIERKYPDSLNLKIALSALIQRLPKYGSFQDGSFVRTRKYSDVAPDKLCVTDAHDRVLRLRTLASGLATVESEYSKLLASGSSSLSASELDRYYGALENALYDTRAENYDGLADLTDWSADVPPVLRSEDAKRRFSVMRRHVDENDNPLCFSAPERFEDAKSDGERFQLCVARRLDLTDRLGDPEKSFDLYRHYAFIFKSVFGFSTARSTFSSREELDSFYASLKSTVATPFSDSETTVVAKDLTFKRVELPERSNYLWYWNKAAEIKPEFVKPFLADEYALRGRTEEAAKLYAELLASAEEAAESNDDWDRAQRAEGSVARYKSALSNLTDPKLELSGRLDRRFGGLPGYRATVSSDGKLKLSVQVRNAREITAVARKVSLNRVKPYVAANAFSKFLPESNSPDFEKTKLQRAAWLCVRAEFYNDYSAWEDDPFDELVAPPRIIGAELDRATLPVDEEHGFAPSGVLINPSWGSVVLDTKGCDAVLVEVFTENGARDVGVCFLDGGRDWTYMLKLNEGFAPGFGL